MGCSRFLNFISVEWAAGLFWKSYHVPLLREQTWEASNQAPLGTAFSQLKAPSQIWSGATDCHLLLKISGWDTRNITVYSPPPRERGTIIVVQLKYSRVLLESFASKNRSHCVRVQCYILTEATDNIEDLSGPMAVKCIICKNKQTQKKLRNIHFSHYR